MSSFYGTFCVSSDGSSSNTGEKELIFCSFTELPSIGKKGILYITDQGIYYYDNEYIPTTSAGPQWGNF